MVGEAGTCVELRAVASACGRDGDGKVYSAGVRAPRFNHPISSS